MFWIIIRCPGGREAAAKTALERKGYPEVWWPIKKIPLTGAQVRKAKLSGKRPPKFRKVAWVPGYVFVRSDTINLHAINSTRQISLRVLTSNNEPYRLTDTDMARMKDYPDRAKQAVDDAMAQEAAERAARTPVIGQTARITAGPLEGSTGTVLEARTGEWRIDLGAVSVWTAEAERAALE